MLNETAIIYDEYIPTKFHVTWLAKLIITTTEFEKQKSHMKLLCLRHSESEHVMWTSPSDCVVRPFPFFQTTPLRETSVSTRWNCLLSRKSAFSQMNTTALDVLVQSTAIQTVEHTHTHTCTQAGHQHQNFVTC